MSNEEGGRGSAIPYAPANTKLPRLGAWANRTDAARNRGTLRWLRAMTSLEADQSKRLEAGARGAVGDYPRQLADPYQANDGRWNQSSFSPRLNSCRSASAALISHVSS
mmetsp:Transcript_10803/g.40536  ORF Transcript_10803/g.40536 Transcript_10803/m.40536 type:complete len:109 (+) Transcript_10803:39-365(+)